MHDETISPFNDIPLDVFEHLTTFLDKEDVINASCVCRSWKMPAELLTRTIAKKHKQLSDNSCHVFEKTLADVFQVCSSTLYFGDDGDTMLHIIARNGNSDCLRAFFSRIPKKNHKLYCNSANYKGDTPLGVALVHENLTFMKELLNYYDADPNLSNNWGESPLMLAAIDNNREAVELLIHYGANINQQANDGASPLYGAVLENNIEMVELLLRRGALIDLPDHEGCTPFQVSVRESFYCLSKILLNKGADPKRRTFLDGSTALHIAVLNSDEEMVNLIGSFDDCGNIKSYNGSTALHTAAKTGSGVMARCLLNAFPNLNFDEEDIQGKTAIYYAAIDNNAAILHLLLEKGARVDIGNAYREIDWSNYICKNRFRTLFEI